MPKVIAARRSQGALSRDLFACHWRIRIPYPVPDISLAAAPSNATLAVQITDGLTRASTRGEPGPQRPTMHASPGQSRACGRR